MRIVKPLLLEDFSEVMASIEGCDGDGALLLNQSITNSDGEVCAEAQGVRFAFFDSQGQKLDEVPIDIPHVPRLEVTSLLNETERIECADGCSGLVESSPITLCSDELTGIGSRLNAVDVLRYFQRAGVSDLLNESLYNLREKNTAVLARTIKNLQLIPPLDFFGCQIKVKSWYLNRQRLHARSHQVLCDAASGRTVASCVVQWLCVSTSSWKIIPFPHEVRV